ncbi:type IV pilus modification protein PilV [Microbulbifer sp. JMSA003]|uniref:type IV pilus modification protein PilV n=1 Tax=Microbulbifer sp. JMSA003 TaxID=3243369 RepID=UPI00403A458B
MHKQKGATLVEVLVSVLIIAVGLLGLASTQVMSLKSGNNAHHRYMATLAAQEIIERMRANSAAFSTGGYDGTVPSTDTSTETGTDTSTETGTDTSTDTSTDEVDSTPSCASKCTSAQMASLDLFEWGKLLSDNLPDAEGRIVRNSGEVTVTISWSEQNSGKDYGSGASASKKTTYEMTVEL